MKKIYLGSLLLVLFSVGCGKKKQDIKETVSVKVTKTDDEIPLAFNGDDVLEEEGNVKDLAFVEEDFDDVEATSAQSSHTGLKKSVPAENAEYESSFQKVYFDFNKNTIKPDQKSALKADIEAAKRAVAAGKKIVIHGHTDQMGSASYNLALSQERAEAVKAEMVNAGIPSQEIKTLGFGYESPIVWSDKTERTSRIKELAPNRRAEIFVE